MELLAPAGNWEAFLAAMKNGADAVYLGGKSYSARQSAENFDLEQIKTAADYAHLRDKKVYVTVNTLIDNAEMAGLLDYLYELQQRNVDAVIVQDIGLITVCRQVLPQMRLHASTQMTVHNPDGAAYLKNLGLKRIVLARELCQADIQTIHDRQPKVELEVFGHGALCFAYSGQCLFSSMVGGRSGNRGRCAQPCRLPYELNSQSGKFNLDPGQRGKHLLSPADLCLIEHLAELKEAGVGSLKIEGRMKRPEYVAVVTRAYREALDLMEKAGQRPAPETKEKLLKIFNRSFSSGYFLGPQEGFLSTRRPNNRGVYIGRVLEQNADLTTQIKLSDRVQSGDGLVVWVGKGKNPVILLKELFIDNQAVQQAAAGATITLKMEERVFPGDRVFKTHDEALITEAQQSIQEEEAHKIVVDGEVNLALGQPLQLILIDDKANRVEAETDNIAQTANKYPLNEEVLRDKLGRLGNTPFILRDLKIKGDENLMLPFSDMNDVRRKATDLLLEKRLQSHQKLKISRSEFKKEKGQVLRLPLGSNRKAKPRLTVSVSNTRQAGLALAEGADRVLLRLEGIGSRQRPTRAQIAQLIDNNKGALQRIVPVLPRIHLPAERYAYRDLLESGFSGLMVGNWGDLKWGLQAGYQLMTDYSFNVFNAYSLQFFVNQGIGSVCLSPELNFKQLHSFPDFAKVEMLVHGEMMLMESQYCILRDLLGTGEDKCTAPCSLDQYCLRDEKGYQFPVTTDADCRFYVYNSRTLCLMEDLARVLDLGPQSIRIEAQLSGDEELVKTIKLYRLALDELLAGKEPDLAVYKEELAARGKSFTKGHYYRGVL